MPCVMVIASMHIKSGVALEDLECKVFLKVGDFKLKETYVRPQ